MILVSFKRSLLGLRMRMEIRMKMKMRLNMSMMSRMRMTVGIIGAALWLLGFLLRKLCGFCILLSNLCSYLLYLLVTTHPVSIL